jgi:glycosyltransferase involved in cell wall biosynthesis
MSGIALAYVLKKFPRLSETFILNELLELENQGLPIRVFSRRSADTEPRHPQLSALRAEVEVLPSIRELDPWTVMFAGGSGPGVLERLRGVVAEGGEWRHPRFPSLLAEALHLYRRCGEMGIRHVHAHFATDSAVVARLLRRLGGPAYSLTVHAKDIYREGIDFDLMDGLFRESEFVVTVCEANVEHLRSRVGSEAGSRVRCLYNGIDLERFAYQGEPAARDEGHVLAVGRLVEKKGLHVLVAALAALEARGLEVRATIIGDGDRLQRLERQVEEAGLQERVHLVGAADQGVVAEAMARATVFCLPCVVGADGNRDALPTVLLEALASGLPVVSTPVTGIPEILAGGRAGVIVPAGDAEATAAAIADLLADPERRRALAEAGRDHVERHFDRRSNVAVLAGWLREALRAQAESHAEVPGPVVESPRERVRNPSPVVAAQASGPLVALVNQDSGIGPGREKGAAVHLEAMAEAFRELGSRVVRIDEPEPDRLVALLDQHGAEGVDLVYERYTLGRTLALRWAQSKGIAHVLEVNAPLAEENLRYRNRPESPEEMAADARLFTGSDRVIAVSTEVASYAAQRGADESRIRVFPNGVDTDLFRPRTAWDERRRALVPAGRVALGFHGRLRPWHGFERVAEAAGRLLRDGLPLHLVLVGSGEFASALDRRVPSSAVSRVEWVPHAEVCSYVAAFDLLPLAYGEEGQAYFSPLKLAEAMACGVVPVVPRVGDLTKIVTHGETGWTYRVGAVDALEQSLRRLVQDDSLRQRLGRQARERAKELSWKRVASFALEAVPEERPLVLEEP